MNQWFNFIMEILIIGVILVALMAYVSTKIKNEAKRAYELEVVENEYFTITKPNDFIIPVKEKSEFVFETYSKEFGEDEAVDKFNQCWAVIVEKNGIEADIETMETEKIEHDVTIKNYHKTLVSNSLNKSFELEISVLPEYEEKYSAGIKLMLNSFALK